LRQGGEYPRGLSQLWNADVAFGIYSKPLGRIVLANPALPTVPLDELLCALPGSTGCRMGTACLEETLSCFPCSISKLAAAPQIQFQEG